MSSVTEKLKKLFLKSETKLTNKLIRLIIQKKKRTTLFMEQMCWVLDASIPNMFKDEHLKSLKMLTQGT